jgi:hypothetical protein
LNPAAHVVCPLEEAYDPGDEFIDQFLQVELTAPDPETRLHATEVRTTGHYMHLPPELDEKRQRKLDEVSTEEAERRCREAFAAANKAAYERSLAPPPVE